VKNSPLKSPMFNKVFFLHIQMVYLLEKVDKHDRCEKENLAKSLSPKAKKSFH
jgi:hypothetical protein